MKINLTKRVSIVIFTLLVSLSASVFSYAQKVKIERVEPPSWWTGMKHEKLQLLIEGENIAESEVQINYPGVTLEKVHPADNEKFLFLDLNISSQTNPGTFSIQFTNEKKKSYSYPYELKTREKGRDAFQGLDQTDVMYLITPDRFVNADPTNDEVDFLTEKKNREFHSGRHGGDLAGIGSKIDYMKDLGITAVWLNPVLENNMKEYSYHGYAITDYYKVDARFGTNKDYKQLTNQFHENGIKMIMDMVFNHCGLEHWWMKEMPFRDWIHYYPDYVNTNHAKSAFPDHAAQSDIDQNEKGWFVSQMPDLNQDNPFMANYLIENSIWWIEYLGLDGIRMDTHPYNKPEFMKEWADRVYLEYPDFYLVGETWVEDEATEAFWAYKDPRKDSNRFNSGLNSVTDFPLCFAIHKVFQPDGNVYDLYRVISKDFLYDDPEMNKIFADNHDMDRFYHTIGEDLDKFKMAMTFLLTTRGIPEIYYGTEILMRRYGEHGILRQDFPGGWPGDERNAFTKAGRTDEENEAFDHIRKLLHWRKNSDAIKNGKLIHYIPYDNVYVYNQRSDNESVVVILNNNDKSVDLDLSRYNEILDGYESAADLLNGEEYDNFTTIHLESYTSYLLKLNPLLKSELR